MHLLASFCRRASGMRLDAFLARIAHFEAGDENKLLQLITAMWDRVSCVGFLSKRLFHEGQALYLLTVD